MIRRLLAVLMTTGGVLISGTVGALDVFQDPTNTGTLPAAALGILVGGGSVPINLYYRVVGSPSSDPNTVCVSGNGAEVCAWDVHIAGTGGVSLQSFLPEPASDIVASISGNVLRSNGGDPINGEIVAARRMGTLMVSASSAGTVSVVGNLVVTAALGTVPVPTGTVLAQTDNCPTLVNLDQLDSDGDGVGDACDNCLDTPNPRACVPSDHPGGGTCTAYLAVPGLAGHDWATVTGGQRDDDHDGFGNHCDGDFNQQQTLIGTADTGEIANSLGKLVNLDTCGATGTRPCAIFDMNETQTTIGTPDVGIYATTYNGWVGAGPPPPGVTAIRKCASCPLPCQAGSLGSCGP